MGDGEIVTYKDIAELKDGMNKGFEVIRADINSLNLSLVERVKGAEGMIEKNKEAIDKIEEEQSRLWTVHDNYHYTYWKKTTSMIKIVILALTLIAVGLPIIIKFCR